ncbi:hypothetical protein ZHAS_00009939 [Anopheles sinensis]|uniref:FR47 domain-containing protein n=1 Tax=Anopheles sinensis TaxID=74873 RepID=A0A084VWB6_ANOSI|nr:hypothetical protein ZHAS_00009939 [Anopheles sinensis]
MEDRLVKIPTGDWMEWRDLYKTDWPRHEVSYNLIQNYIDWLEQGAELKEFTALSLNGEWAKDGTYIDRHEMFIYTLDGRLESLRRALLLLDWTRSYLINMGLYRSLLMDIYQLFNLDILFDMHTYIYYLPHEDASKLEVDVPDGFKFGPLKPDDAIFINDEWPHKYPGSELFIERLITRNLNLALFDGDGNLMAWCMRVQNGAMAMLGVAQTRRGYGSMMALGFARKLGELGLNVYASVIHTNEPSRKMFDKLCPTAARIATQAVALADIGHKVSIDTIANAGAIVAVPIRRVGTDLGQHLGLPTVVAPAPRSRPRTELRFVSTHQSQVDAWECLD